MSSIDHAAMTMDLYSHLIDHNLVAAAKKVGHHRGHMMTMTANVARPVRWRKGRW
jgi:hypothetical protein